MNPEFQNKIKATANAGVVFRYLKPYARHCALNFKQSANFSQPRIFLFNISSASWWDDSLFSLPHAVFKKNHQAIKKTIHSVTINALSGCVGWSVEHLLWPRSTHHQKAPF